MDYKKFIMDLYERHNLSFLGSVDGDGFPNIRAMLRPRRMDGIETIYFSTNTSTNKIRHYEENDKACVYFCDPFSFKGALLVGRMEILDSPEYKEMLWRDGDEMYYPGGVTDPDYITLRFTAISGRVYSDLKTEKFSL